MAKRILVPVGARGEESEVLPLVADVSRSSGATVRLIHVMPMPEARIGEYGRIVAYESQEMERLEYEGRDLLKAAEAKLEGVPVESVVRFGQPAEEILHEAEAFQADLIAVTTTKRGRLARLLSGVADQVLRKAEVPVLLLRAA